MGFAIPFSWLCQVVLARDLPSYVSEADCTNGQESLSTLTICAANQIGFDVKHALGLRCCVTLNEKSFGIICIYGTTAYKKGDKYGRVVFETGIEDLQLLKEHSDYVTKRKNRIATTEKFIKN